MQKLIGLLKKEFGTKREDVRLIVDVTVASQIDAIVYKDGKFVILEFKDIDGDITIDLSGKRRMKKRVGEREIELRGNPLTQITWQRNELMSFVWEQVLNRDEELTHEGTEYEEFGHYFGAWVVCNPGSDITPVGREPKEIRWFAALPLDHVPRSLWLEMGEKTVVNEEEFGRLVEKLSAKETTWDEWIRLGALVVKEEDIESPRIQSVDESLLSEKTEDVIMALNQIHELGLRNYLQEVLNATTSQHSTIRRKALDILLLWNPPQLGSVMTHFLNDKDDSLRKFVLELMSKRPCPEALSELGGFLKSDDYDTIVRGLRALGTTGSHEACRHVLEFAESRPFGGGPDDSIPRRTVVAVLGQLRCKEAAPMLLGMIDLIEQREPIGHDNMLDILREEIIQSLGRIGDEHALPFLVDAVKRYQGHWVIAPIRALGDLGDERSVDHLVPFVNHESDWVKNETARALAKIRSKRAFEPLARYYVEGPEEKGPLAVRLPVMKALIAIDPRQTETYMVDRLRNEVLDNDTIRRILRLLYVVATEVSINVLFSLTGDEDHYTDAAGILGERIGTQGVFSRASRLLHSKNEYERASGIHIMSSNWGKDLLIKLREHEKDPSHIVRRAVAEMYYVADSVTARKRLLTMAQDEDSDVRSTVYHAHFSKPKVVLRECFVCSDDDCFRPRYVILGEGAILSDLNDERVQTIPEEEDTDESCSLLVICVDDIERADIINVGEAGTGLYISGKTEGRAQGWLFVCDESFPFNGGEQIRDFIKELRRTAGRDVLRTGLTDLDRERIRILSGLIPKEETGNSDE